MSFIYKNISFWTFDRSSAIKAFNDNTITKEQKKLFLEAAHVRSDVAGVYIFLYKDELDVSQRQMLFDTLLGGRDHTLWFMKKKIYTEEERLKFQRKLSTMLVIFFKYLKKFPDLLRDNEKDVFFNNHKKTILTVVFRNDFNGLMNVFKEQLNNDEIIKIVDQMLKLKGKRGKFLSELLSHIESNGIPIKQEKEDLLVSYMTMDLLTGE